MFEKMMNQRPNVAKFKNNDFTGGGGFAMMNKSIEDLRGDLL